MSEEKAGTSYRWVGKPVVRVDGVGKVRGNFKFPTDDIPEGVYYCAPVFAPFPHAKLMGIDTTSAQNLTGVVRVITHKDIPGKNLFGFRNDRPGLCDEKTRYIGDMVAIVVATTEQAAKDAVDKVKIDWEPLPLITDPDQAVAIDAPLIHAGGNVLHQIHYARGDVDGAFAQDDVVTVEGTYTTQMMDHAFLETEAATAYPEDGGVKVIAGAQVPYADQTWLSLCLDLPPEKVHLIEPYSGGAFGGRGDLSVQLVVALAALLTQHPCRMAWDRSEHFRAGPKRHPYKIRIRLAANRAGELQAIEANIIADTGAYALFGDNILGTTVENITGLYRYQNVRVDAWCVYTNNPICGAFRGFGAPQACLALEGSISELAEKLGIDELEFRQRNLLRQGEMHGMGHTLLLPTGVAEALETARKHPLWKAHGKPASARTIKKGIGVALATKGYGLGTNDAPDFSAADLTLGENGRFLLTTGIVEIGQGSHTVLVQMAAETLNCGPEFFDISTADTIHHPESGTSAASRITYAVGLAAVEVARVMSQKIRTLAAQKWEVPIEQVRITDGYVVDEKSKERLSLTDIARLGAGGLHVRKRLRMPYTRTPSTGGLAHPHVLYSSNVQIAEVSVDTETGAVTVDRVVSFPEAGKVINPLGLEGQCEGGVAQGIAYALMEEVVLEEGAVVNDNFSVYTLPTSMDTPPVEVIPVEVPEASGPFGAKGAAENATIPTAPAILDAVANAVDRRFKAIPVTPETMLRSLAGKPG